MTEDEEAYTRDAFYNGRLILRQESSGYRFSIDPVLLAGHTDLKPYDRVVDLGTGCGIIPLLLACGHPDAGFVGVEIQRSLVRLAMRNVSENGMENRVRIVTGDLRILPPDAVGAPADVVVCNPPYHPMDTGRINPNTQKAVARHEIKATLADIVKAANRLLKVSGRLVIIYPAIRMADIIFCMREGGIEPKFLRPVYSYRNTPAKMIIVRGIKGGGTEMEIAPPLYIYKEDGSYSAEVQKMFEPGDTIGAHQ